MPDKARSLPVLISSFNSLTICSECSVSKYPAGAKSRGWVARDPSNIFFRTEILTGVRQGRVRRGTNAAIAAAWAYGDLFKSANRIAQKMGPPAKPFCEVRYCELRYPCCCGLSGSGSSTGLTGKFHSTIRTLSKTRFGAPAKQNRLPVSNRQSPPPPPLVNGQSGVEPVFGDATNCD